MPPAQPRQTRRVPKRDHRARNLGIGVGILIIVAVIGLAFAIARHNATRTLNAGDGQVFGVDCNKSTVYEPFQLGAVSEVNAIFFHPNQEGRTVGEEVHEGDELYVDTPCGRYAVAVVTDETFKAADSGQASSVTLRSYFWPVRSDRHNKEQVAPAPGEKVSSSVTFNLKPQDIITVEVRGAAVNHDFVLRWDGMQLKSLEPTVSCGYSPQSGLQVFECQGFQLVQVATVTPDGILIGFSPAYNGVIIRH